MRQILPLILLATSSAAMAASPLDALKDMAKQQANQQMESRLNMPQAAPANAKASIISPKNGDTVSSPVRVVFGLSNMGVAPAGTNQAGTGHFHLLIDEPELDLSQPIPGSAQVIHYGGGQIESTVELKPGKHTLQLLMGDWKHLPQQPAVMSEKVVITVK
ncbi:MAG: DUF4399 domain-containing protein [Perlucidibaca sp.]